MSPIVQPSLLPTALLRTALLPTALLRTTNIARHQIGYADNDESKDFTNSTNTGAALRIGIVIVNFESTYYGRIVNAAANSLRKLGHEAIVHSNGGTRKGEISAWHSLMRLNCDGVILQANLMNDHDLDSLMELYPNTVLIKRSHERFSNNCIYLDNYLGGVQAARYLIENGHRRMAMVSGPSNYHELVDRRQGFIDTLREHDNDALLALEVEADLSEGSGARSMHQVINHDKQISAVFFHNDDLAVSALDWCHDHGICVPQEISILGFDNIQFTQYTSPRLTTIKQPIREIGEAAALHMINLLASKESDQNKTVKRNFAPKLIERCSVKCLLLDSEENYNDIKPVSEREKTCLYWAARGKTSQEISVILSIKDATVNFHLKNSLRKLKTTNRTHSVAEAIRLGVISI